VHGLTVPHDGANAIGEALLQLFRDPVLRRRMGEAARNRAVENYSTAGVMDRYERLLTEVIGSGSNPL
jgi:glycosyltransferase involved in cell wall biosynthesis